MTDEEIAVIRKNVQLLMEGPLDSDFRQVMIAREFRDDLCVDFNALLVEVERLRANVALLNTMCDAFSSDVPPPR